MHHQQTLPSMTTQQSSLVLCSAASRIEYSLLIVAIARLLSRAHLGGNSTSPTQWLRCFGGCESQSQTILSAFIWASNNLKPILAVPLWANNEHGHGHPKYRYQYNRVDRLDSRYSRRQIAVAPSLYNFFEENFKFARAIFFLTKKRGAYSELN